MTPITLTDAQRQAFCRLIVEKLEPITKDEDASIAALAHLTQLLIGSLWNTPSPLDAVREAARHYRLTSSDCVALHEDNITRFVHMA